MNKTEGSAKILTLSPMMSYIKVYAYYWKILVLDIHRYEGEIAPMERLLITERVVRLSKGEFFFSKPVVIHGRDVTILGDGITSVINLTRPLSLKDYKAGHLK